MTIFITRKISGVKHGKNKINGHVSRIADGSLKPIAEFGVDKILNHWK